MLPAAVFEDEPSTAAAVPAELDDMWAHGFNALDDIGEVGVPDQDHLNAATALDPSKFLFQADGRRIARLGTKDQDTDNGAHHFGNVHEINRATLALRGLGRSGGSAERLKGQLPYRNACDTYRIYA